jgi:hypothetical protein
MTADKSRELGHRLRIFVQTIEKGEVGYEYLSDHGHTWHTACARLYESGVKKATAVCLAGENYGEDHEW